MKRPEDIRSPAQLERALRCCREMLDEIPERRTRVYNTQYSQVSGEWTQNDALRWLDDQELVYRIAERRLEDLLGAEGKTDD